MAEVYTEHGPHRSHRNVMVWVLFAVIAAILLAVIIAYLR